MKTAPTAIELDGWDDASIWGWDPTLHSYYAQLWPNDSDPDEPPIHWIGIHHPCRNIDELAEAIAAVTGFSPDDCHAALDPPPDAAV